MLAADDDDAADEDDGTAAAAAADTPASRPVTSIGSVVDVDKNGRNGTEREDMSASCRWFSYRGGRREKRRGDGREGGRVVVAFP